MKRLLGCQVVKNLPQALRKRAAVHLDQNDLIKYRFTYMIGDLMDCYEHILLVTQQLLFLPGNPKLFPPLAIS